MSTTFASLKTNRVSALDKLAKEVTKMAKKGSADERFWKCATDKTGNGQATIRFLAAPEGEEIPFVRLWHHAFKGPGGQWYFENSLTTIGQDDPVSEYNSKLWAQGEKGQNIARAQKRKLRYIANILVIKDPAHPENEGKVFLFSFGKKIFDKLNEKMTPEFEDEKPMNPFDLWEGANFKLRIRKVEGFTNYDKSEFETPGPVAKDDKAIEAVWKLTHKLQQFVAADQFKSYKELKDRLEKVLALPTSGAPTQSAPAPEPSVSASRPSAPSVDEDEDEEPVAAAPAEPAVSGDENPSPGKKKNLAFFADLAKD